MKNNIAFITPIEQNKFVDINGEKIYRYFEDEAIRCIKSIRQSKSWLEKLPIYVLNMNNAQIKDDTVKQLLKYNVNYINDPYDNAKYFLTDFLNEPYTGKYFETINPIDEEITIKIDLDMKMIKPISYELVISSSEKPIIGQYDVLAKKQQRALPNNMVIFDTNLIITHKQHNFYSLYFDLCFDDCILKSDEWKQIQCQYGNYYLEEFVVDYIYKNNIMDITPIQYYQFGEGYPSIDTYPQEKLNDIYFLHEHIYKNGQKSFDVEYNSIIQQLKYIKRTQKKHDTL